MTQRAYIERDRICCAACSAPMGRVRGPGEDGSYWPDLDEGWMLRHGVWTITPRARARLREGRRPMNRRRPMNGPGSDPKWHYIVVPANIECWSCGLPQVIDDNLQFRGRRLT